jgi:hypothetical protein
MSRSRSGRGSLARAVEPPHPDYDGPKVMKGKDTFTEAESAAIRKALDTLRRADRPAQKSIRESLRQQSGFYISDWPRDATGFTRSDFDELVRQSRIHVQG